MAWCLPFELASKIKEAIRSGNISPEKLNTMTSAERRAFLAKIVGEENAKQINLSFERKLLLVNQERAMYDWARSITGLSKAEKEATLAKIRETYAKKEARLYEPKESEKFLNEIVSDVFSKKYKTEVSLEEAQKITELTSVMRQAKAKMNDDFTWKSKQDGLNFGAAKVALDNYTNGLKLEATKAQLIAPWRVEGAMGKVRAIEQDVGTMVDFIAANSRAIVASVDNSWWGRQGLKTLLTRPNIWGKNFVKSWSDIYQIVRYGKEKGDAIVDGVKAEIYSRQNYLNGRYEKGKRLDIGTGEEAFPTSAPAKIPAFGRLFKAAEIAYEAGAMRMRVDIADWMYKLAEKNKVDLNDKFEIGSINEVVNSLTGRGRISMGEGIQTTVNKAFFSIKFAKSNIDFLTLHAGSKMSSFAKKQAAINLLQVTAELGAILGIANALWPDSVEFNPTSANFGKIKIGNTRIDITGGNAPFVTLAARIITRSVKSSITGIVTKLGEGYKATVGTDLIWDFMENKYSPMLTVIKDLINNETFEGGKPTAATEAASLGEPLVIQQGWQMSKDPNSGNILIGLIADALGFSANTYTLQDNWETSTSKELEQFKATIGEKEFKNANDKYNLGLNNFISKVTKDPDYQALSNDDKKEMITWKKGQLKSDIFKEYDFKYKKGAVPEFNEGDEVSNDGIISTVVLYAKAVGVDPLTAFERIFTGQKIRRIDNSTIIVERIPLSESQAIKQQRGATDDMILDHTIPLELGGSNGKDNLKLVPISEWNSYTPIENYLGGLLRTGEIDKKTAQGLIKDFKEGKITAEYIKSNY